MKRLLILVMCIVISTTGCLTGQNNDEEEKNMMNNGKAETYNEENKEMSDVARLYSFLIENKKGDGKSVFWDGKEAVLKEDNLDFDNIVDGRSVSEGPEKYTVDKLIECTYPVGFELVEIDEARPDCCRLTKGKNEIIVSRVDYEEEINQIDEDQRYIEIDFMGIQENRIKYFKNFKTYIGICELSGEEKAGYILVFESKLADRSYKIEVYGIGNMSELKSEALEVMNGFDVLFY